MCTTTGNLAINGGVPAKNRADPPMFPGAMSMDQEEENAVLEVLRRKRLFRYSGPGDYPSKVAELEATFATIKGATYAVAVTSGTAALICAIHGLGIGPGDEVILPAYTWIASAAAILAAGAVPILADIDETLCLNPTDVEKKITPYTKAIMAVHMCGASCRMDELLAIAIKHNLSIIEDTAQANGASYKGKPLGSIGDVGCYSLQFHKIITAGEGGLVVTNNEEIWKRTFMYHDVIGPLRKGFENEFLYDELICGVNYRMPELLAALSLVQLQRLEELLTSMRTRKKMIKEGMADVVQRKGIVFRDLTDPTGDASTAIIFFVENPKLANYICEALCAENIGARTLYKPNWIDYHVYAHWIPVINKRVWSSGGDPWQWAHREIVYSSDMCVRSLELLERSVHLNISPHLTNIDVEETVEGLNKVLNALA